MYASQFVREWDGRDSEIVEQREAVREKTSAAYRKDTEIAAVYMGESAGDVDSIRPAAELLAEICEGAEELLRRSNS